MIFFASSCRTGIKFDPDWYVADHVQMDFMNEDGLIIGCDSPEIEQGAWMSKEKMKELAEILRRARIPKREVKRLTIPHFNL